MSKIDLSLSPVRSARPAQPLTWLAALLAYRRQRHDLAALEPHQLQDIGLTPEDVRNELRRPVWDAPQNWFL